MKESSCMRFLAAALLNMTQAANAGIITTVAGVGRTCDGIPAIYAVVGTVAESAIDASGNLYIVQRGDHLVGKVDMSTGMISTVAGTGEFGYNGDGIDARDARLYEPNGICLDGSGNLYIVDGRNNRIRRVDAVTGLISTVAGTGVYGYNGDGIDAVDAELRDPWGICLDGSGNLYIADTQNFRIRKVDAATGLISTVAGTGEWGYNGDGIEATDATLTYPNGICPDAFGNLYIADSWNNRIRRVDAVTGLISTVAGTGVYGYNGDGIDAVDAQLRYPCGICLASSGNLYIADTYNCRLRKVNTGTGLISTVAGSGSYGYDGDGIDATWAGLILPLDSAFDRDGNLYIADMGNDRIRKVDAANGLISTVAGTGDSGYNGDEIEAIDAELRYPSGICLDASGNLYIADSLNNRIRKVDAATGLISTVAGTGEYGYNGDGIQATEAWSSTPSGICLDDSNNLYIADTYNNRIRKVDAATGIISTVAGTGYAGYNRDGIDAADAWLNAPRAICLDDSNNLYIADTYNNRIRKVDAATGIISTVAGTGVCCYNGDGIIATSATLNRPKGVAINRWGKIYIADSGNHRIRKVVPSTGLISTVAGIGTGDYNGDGIEATRAFLNDPNNVSFDRWGDLYIADGLNNRIRKVALSPEDDPLTGIAGAIRDKLTRGEILVAPNMMHSSESGSVVIYIKGDPNVAAEVEIYDEVGDRFGVLRVFLDSEGFGHVAIQGGVVEERRLVPGAYWVLVRSGGARCKKGFMVAR